MKLFQNAIVDRFFLVFKAYFSCDAVSVSNEAINIVSRSFSSAFN